MKNIENVQIQFNENPTIKKIKEEDLSSSTTVKENYSLDSIKKEYQSNIRINILMLKIMLSTNDRKSTIVYQMGFVIELTLKYRLLSEKSLEYIGKLNHDLEALFKVIEQAEIDNIEKISYIDLYDKMKKIKRGINKEIAFNEYNDLKYNHKKGETILIIPDNKISKKDIERVKEVIKCVENIMNF